MSLDMGCVDTAKAPGLRRCRTSRFGWPMACTVLGDWLRNSHVDVGETKCTEEAGEQAIGTARTRSGEVRCIRNGRYSILSGASGSGLVVLRQVAANQRDGPFLAKN